VVLRQLLFPLPPLRQRQPRLAPPRPRPLPRPEPSLPLRPRAPTLLFSPAPLPPPSLTRTPALPRLLRPELSRPLSVTRTPVLLHLLRLALLHPPRPRAPMLLSSLALLLPPSLTRTPARLCLLPPRRSSPAPLRLQAPTRLFFLELLPLLLLLAPTPRFFLVRPLRLRLSHLSRLLLELELPRVPEPPRALARLLERRARPLETPILRLRTLRRRIRWWMRSGPHKRIIMGLDPIKRSGIECNHWGQIFDEWTGNGNGSVNIKKFFRKRGTMNGNRRSL
jgi:hypothetical protein